MTIRSNRFGMVLLLGPRAPRVWTPPTPSTVPAATFPRLYRTGRADPCRQRTTCARNEADRESRTRRERRPLEARGLRRARRLAGRRRRGHRRPHRRLFPVVRAGAARAARRALPRPDLAP